MRATIAACVIMGICGAFARDGRAEDRTMDPKRTFGPPKGSRWVAIPELTDEFDGEKLDSSKWHDHNPTWKGRQPAWFAKHNVTVSKGMLHLAMRAENLKGLPKGYHTFTSAAVKSTAAVRYGYFEIRCKPMDSHGSSAFWFYAQTPEIWTEIDVFEMGAGAPKHERIVHMNAHVFHTLVNPDRHWSKGGKWTAPWRLADGYHVYSLQWDADELKYLVDGAVVRRMPNTHWHQPLYLNFDSETMPKWFGLPKTKDLPSTFSIDYVRSWRKADGPAPGRARSVEFAFDRTEAAAAKGKTRTYRLKVKEGGELLVIARHSGASRPALVHVEYDHDAFFGAQKASTIRKTIHLGDRRGRDVAFALAWSRVKGYKKHRGYRADSVDIVGVAKSPAGRTTEFRFLSDGGQEIRASVAP